MRVWMKRIFLLAVMACYLTFAYLLYQRWVTTEQVWRGPVAFVALVGQPDETMSASQVDALNRRVGWGTVLAPLWVADALTVCAHVSLLVVQHTWRPLPTSLNARIEHVSGALRAVLYAVFKALLIDRLAAPDATMGALSQQFAAAASAGSADAEAGAAGAPTIASWWLVFAPIYAAAILQMVLHSCKTLEGGETLFRGRESSRPRRRPGFALTLDDTLAFNISLHLNGVFYIHSATWSLVFWPLWLVAAICGVGLFLLLCFGVPMLSRRYPIRQFLMVLPPLLLLLATYSLALQALVKGVTWLDAPYTGITAAEVMG